MKQIYKYLFIALLVWFKSSTCFSQTKTNIDSSTIAFVSDTQAPLFIESLIRKTNHNTKATELIFNHIIGKRPSCVFILGDVVSLGCSTKKWKRMDEYLITCRQNNIPVYAALGNHELMCHAKKGAAKFQSRFPTHSPIGYVTIVDSVAVMLLNSNFNKMKKLEIEKQDKWYTNTIEQLNINAAIKFIVVACHHSPFTNSSVVAPSKLVQLKFLPLFFASNKCVLFLSGHSHNFERFNIQEKNFLVIGGGGGIHQPLRTGKKLFAHVAATYKPMFHYLTLNRNNNSLQIVSHQLKNDFSGFKEGLNFTIKNN